MTRFDAARQELDGFMREYAPSHYPTVDAPSTYEALKGWYSDWQDRAKSNGTHFCMPVSSEHCENTIYLDVHGNHAFRAWHDWGHLQYGLPFTFEGEIRLAVKHQSLAERMRLGKDARYLLWIDTAMQSKYERDTGEFPENQLEFARFWFGRYEVRHVR